MEKIKIYPNSKDINTIKDYYYIQIFKKKFDPLKLYFLNYHKEKEKFLKLKKTPKFLYYLLIGYLIDLYKQYYVQKNYIDFKYCGNNFYKRKIKENKFDFYYYIIYFIPKKPSFERGKILDYGNNSFLIDNIDEEVKEANIKNAFLDFQKIKLPIYEKSCVKLYKHVLKNSFFYKNYLIEYSKNEYDYKIKLLDFFEEIYFKLEIDDSLENFINIMSDKFLETMSVNANKIDNLNKKINMSIDNYYDKNVFLNNNYIDDFNHWIPYLP